MDITSSQTKLKTKQTPIPNGMETPTKGSMTK